MSRPFHRRFRCVAILLPTLLISLGISSTQPLSAADYFLTIGGGYNPTGNQASLEANVVFFQQVLTEKHRGQRRHGIYFADGQDPGNDLQVLIEKPAKSLTPATDVLAALHRRGEEIDVTYRNHRVTQIAGPLDPNLIRTEIENLAKTTRAGDRVIIYVTAHGSEGPEDDEYNTTIDCWNEKKITAREFTGWLSKLPTNVPVVMVMAQCYCGGFGHSIFQDLNESKGLAPQIRAGFFAQQYNLPAAGCRPDIEHDEEFSSYFWGALTGRSRNGVPIKDCDIDNNGQVSFAEAYAYAVTAGETVDIPLRTSEVLLRTYSRLKPEEVKVTPPKPETSAKPETSDKKPEGTDQPTTDVSATAATAEAAKEPPVLSTMNGTLQSFVDRGRPVSGRIVTQLIKTLGFTPQDDVSAVIAAYDKHRRGNRGQARGRGRRQGGRREVLKEIAAKWPELGDERKWEKSEQLKPENQEKLLAELQQLPSWKGYEERQKQRKTSSKAAEVHELREVKFRRLINALEMIILEQNLPLVAKPEIVTRYQQTLALEESTLSPR
jgi:hypothetical protein